MKIKLLLDFLLCASYTLFLYCENLEKILLKKESILKYFLVYWPLKVN